MGSISAAPRPGETQKSAIIAFPMRRDGEINGPAAACEKSGLKAISKLDEIDDEKPFKHYLKLFELKSTLEIVSTQTGIGFDRLLQVDHSRFYSFDLRWQLRDVLEEELFRDKRRKIEFSNTVDIDFAAFALYLKVVMDKRTLNIVNSVAARGYPHPLIVTTVTEFEKQLRDSFAT